IEGPRIAVAGEPFHRGPAGKRQTHTLGDLVKGLSCGIVDGVTQKLIGSKGLDAVEVGVASGNRQTQERKLRLVIDEGAPQMSLDVVYAAKWELQPEGQRLREVQTHQQRADQARRKSYGDAFEVLQAEAASLQCEFQRRFEALQMPAGGDFRHHS